eukprot:TRINITY_DN8054_c0_g1_i1.p1 TRINITY_DN8054_c0_g1~~TRINITY_DN8054_c0_g1_i1.p1  ORF type:complete len:106 (-),score=12.83 TRINITY_DN8054_c0_g1_i1:150-467(-)
MFRASIAMLGGLLWKKPKWGETRRANLKKRMKQIKEVNDFLLPYHIPVPVKESIRKAYRRAHPQEFAFTNYTPSKFYQQSLYLRHNPRAAKKGQKSSEKDAQTTE